MTPGRWTIVSRAEPRPRRAHGWQRARVHVRCVCGVERTVWLEDLEAGKSTGCVSRRCAARYHASEDVRLMLTVWLQREHDALVAMAVRCQPHARKQVEALAAELLRARAHECDEAIRDYLRAPDLSAVIDEEDDRPPPVVAFSRAAAAG